MSKGEPLVDWGFSCGRTYLTVNGFVVAMEGDVLRDLELEHVGYNMMVEKWKDQGATGKLVIDSYGGRMRVWTGELIQYVAEQAKR